VSGLQVTPIIVGSEQAAANEAVAAKVAAPFVQIAPADIARRRFASWNGVRADSVEITRREAFEYRVRSPHHLLILSERAARDDGETCVEGLPKSTEREFSRKLSLIPSGHAFHGWQNPRMLTRVTYFYIDPHSTLIDPELGFAATELRPQLFFFNRDLWETAIKLKAQVENPGPDQQYYGEALGVVLAHEILRLNNGVSPADQEARGGLAGWQKNKVVEYIEEHLGDAISLKALAELARLSPFHFARSFKKPFGLPPHRYLTNRRIERAKNLLTQPDLPVTNIGFDVGFGDANSFSAVFRKSTGLTPTEYRRRPQ
jgi:AraC family transcriptional regulator